jgi:hypothetical protein
MEIWEMVFGCEELGLRENLWGSIIGYWYMDNLVHWISIYFISFVPQLLKQLPKKLGKVDSYPIRAIKNI